MSSASPTGTVRRHAHGWDEQSADCAKKQWGLVRYDGQAAESLADFNAQPLHADTFHTIARVRHCCVLDALDARVNVLLTVMLSTFRVWGAVKADRRFQGRDYL